MFQQNISPKKLLTHIEQAKSYVFQFGEYHELDGQKDLGMYNFSFSTKKKSSNNAFAVYWVFNCVILVLQVRIYLSKAMN